MQRPTVPAPITEPTGSKLVLIAHAEGVQIYVCSVDAAGKLSWVLKAPEAVLSDMEGRTMGSHYAGPTWKHRDGSEITGKMAAKVDAPDSRAIPWLLIEVTGQSGQGILSHVTAIQRIHTVGGLAPTSCTESDRDREVRCTYSADYYFYATTK